jgi:hypothetical protein
MVGSLEDELDAPRRGVGDVFLRDRNDRAGVRCGACGDDCAGGGRDEPLAGGDRAGGERVPDAVVGDRDDRVGGRLVVDGEADADDAAGAGDVDQERAGRDRVDELAADGRACGRGLVRVAVALSYCLDDAAAMC